VVVIVTAARPVGPAALACQGSLEAAGHAEPAEFTAHVADASAETVVLRADLVADRTRFAMTGARWAWHRPSRAPPSWRFGPRLRLDRSASSI
jgi:hypothetical protein